MTHLKIELNNGTTEEVSSGVIEKLYNIVHDNLLDNTSNLIGRLHTSATYQDYIDYLEDAFKVNGVKLLIIDATKKYMRFADPAVLSRMLQYLGDGVGITSSEITNGNWYSNTTDPNTNKTLFTNNTSIISFNELGLLSLITNIPNNTFNGCTNLTTIDLHNITSIGNSAFLNCSKLTSVDLSNVTSISSSAFNGCSSLTTVGDLSNCTSINWGVFSGCSSLTSVNLSNVTIIDEFAFNDCSSLTTVGDLSNVTSIGRVAFANCLLLTSVGDLSNCTSIGNSTFKNCSSLTTVDLSNCTSIDGSAFLNCSKLTSIDLSSCTSIGTEAFKGCTSLQTVSGFSNITSLNSSIFQGCTNLLNINGIDWSKITTIEPYVFYLCSNLHLSNVDLSNTTKINTLAFFGSGITSISNISAGTTLSSKIFSECSSLISATNINKVGNSMFRNCSNLTTVSIGSSVSSIPGGLFENCSNLVSLDINFQNITTIESNGFLKCSKLEFSSPIDLSSVTSIGIGSFQNCSKVIINKFPKSSIYLTCCFSNIGNTTITIPKEVQQLKNLCFGNCANLQTVLFEVDSDPQLVSQLTLMLNAFKGCSNLEGPLSIPEGVTTLDGMNFYGCSSLTSVILPSTLTSMGNGEFLNSGVKSLTIKATTPPTITNQSLGWMPNSLIIYVPSGSVSAYLTALYWSSYASKILAIP